MYYPPPVLWKPQVHYGVYRSCQWWRSRSNKYCFQKSSVHSATLLFQQKSSPHVVSDLLVFRLSGFWDFKTDIRLVCKLEIKLRINCVLIEVKVLYVVLVGKFLLFLHLEDSCFTRVVRTRLLANQQWLCVLAVDLIQCLGLCTIILYSGPQPHTLFHYK